MFKRIGIYKFKKGVVNSSSRKVGEILVQRIGEKLYGHKPSDDTSYDELDDNDKKWEYKSCRVLFDDTKKKSTLYDMFVRSNDLYSRLGKISDIEKGKTIVNIQNIKMHTFDFLMYVLISKDGFDWYKIPKEELEEKVNSGEFPGWSNRHGREEADGKNCQFWITSENLAWHSQYKFNHLSWEEVVEMAKEIKVKKK